MDAYDNKRRTALLYAARFGRTFAVSRLLDAKASLGFADRARDLALCHVRPAKWQMFWAQEGQVPLFAAACNEHLDTVDLLLRAGSNINATDQHEPSILAILLFASPLFSPRYFRTPLHGALEEGDESMANLLLKAGASSGLTRSGLE